MTLTIEQDRAQHALTQIKHLTDQPEQWQARYKSYAKGLPASILSNGLGQALATLLSASKGNHKDAHYVLYHHIEQWLCRSHPLAPYQGAQNVMEAITQHDSTAYRVAQMEAMAYLVWLKKFAAAYLLGEEVDVD
ncbi:type III-B CRISPR module-associated protein Cmr5 [Sulfobacillus thermosulfidooxidans]|uniref:type III-B CRISPR module-associated protein Cmr5 n=1 Tax=Sulfobacillus thermosulfidooxidans TaxID=28034 RepID=UPI0003FA4FEF|nr:type III-B CRISPR module-associated protein Cmr5 [Sulfobacillus thermosulfidooxidans]